MIEGKTVEYILTKEWKCMGKVLTLEMIEVLKKPFGQKIMKRYKLFFFFSFLEISKRKFKIQEIFGGI